MNVEPVPLIFAILAAVGTVVIVSWFHAGIPGWLLIGGGLLNGLSMYVVQRGILADQRLRDFHAAGRDWSD